AHKKTNLNMEQAKKVFPVFALLRVLQTIGAYGLRGLVEGKGHFLRSIQPAIATSLKPLIESGELPLKAPELLRVLNALVHSNALDPLNYLNKEAQTGRLTVRIQSFSYKRQVPKDPSGNGGGFVFDCRAIHNPGRYEPYKKLTGRDLPVQEFLLEQSEMPQFLKGVFHLVDASVAKYKTRNFEHLTVSFGCTGGQHRSVYSADCLAEHLRKDPDLDVIVTHIEQEIKQWKN
ncbi:MAG: RNase adapter RapZ, partial [Bacteroidota bacterium]